VIDIASLNDHMHYFPNVWSSLNGVLLSIRMSGAGGQYLVEKIALSVLKNRHQNVNSQMEMELCQKIPQYMRAEGVEVEAAAVDALHVPVWRRLGT
jgi:hypothetical protein